MAELTKEQQVRALREARFKRNRVTRRHTEDDVTPSSQVTPPSQVTPSSQVTPPSQVKGCPRCKLLEAQLAAFEAEVRWLKQALTMSRQVGSPPMTGAERMRQLRAKRKQAKVRHG